MSFSFSLAPVRRPRLVTLVRVLTIAAVVLAAFVSTSTTPAEATGIRRVAGEDRISTAANVATAGWESADHALLATAVDYPDAISAAALASSLDAPVLLTHPDGLSDPVRGVIDQLGIERVTILGGTEAVSPQVERELTTSGVIADRIAGESRYATAADIARRVAGTDGAHTVALALGNRADEGDAWPDALAAASLAGVDDPVPTLLSHRGDVPAATAQALQDVGAQRVILLGGTAAIGDAVANELTGQGLDVERAYGPTRYGTAIDVADAAMNALPEDSGRLEASQAVFVSGQYFADALSAGALAARRSAPLLLVPQQRLHDRVDAYLRASETPIEHGVLVGGHVAVTGFVQREIDAAIAGEPRPQPEPTCPPNSSPDCRYTYEHSLHTWERLAQCESGGNWSINTGNGYYGGLQFSLSTWRGVGGQGYPHQNDKWEQIWRGELLQDRQGWGAWPSCSRKLGLR